MGLVYKVKEYFQEAISHGNTRQTLTQHHHGRWRVLLAGSSLNYDSWEYDNEVFGDHWCREGLLLGLSLPWILNNLLCIFIHGHIARKKERKKDNAHLLFLHIQIHTQQ